MSLYITPGGRVYDSSIGRFLQKDPLAPPGTNPYVYARNNPLRYVDPRGLREFPGPGWYGLLADPSNPNAPAIWTAPDGTRFEGTTSSVGQPVCPTCRADPSEGAANDQDDAIFVEEFPCPTSEGQHSVDSLYRLAKGATTAGGSAVDLLEMARNVGLTKGYIKAGKEGKRYVILKGYSGLRTKLTGARYLATNLKVRSFVVARKVSGQISRRAVGFTIVSTLAFSVVEGVLDRKTVGEIGVSAAVDMVVAGIGVGASAVVSAGIAGASAGSVVPVVGTAAGFVVGVAVLVVADWLVDKYNVKETLYNAILAAEQRVMNIQTREGWTIGQIISGEALLQWLLQRAGCAW